MQQRDSRGRYVQRPVQDRFWAKVDAHSEGGCWLWVGAKTPNGYGQIWVNGSLVLAHRWSYETLRGPIPPDKELDHLCRTSACVNPFHLEAVTHQENMRRGDAGDNMLKKTHCPQRHPYSLANTYRWRNTRRCKVCKRNQLRQWRRQQEEAA
jgi:hypothetical protein